MKSLGFMAIIEKKCWPEWFEKVKNGSKNFEIRLADEDYKKGDILLLREYDPNTKKYTGNEIRKEITEVSKSKDWKVWTKEDIEKYGFVVMGLK
jgi:hypothetical protein